MMLNKPSFTSYCGDFYGDNGIYPMGATPEQIAEATEILIERFGIENVDFDSIDRERVRDIMIEKFNLVFPYETPV